MMLSITDHRMAEMAGIELLEKIKAINPAVTRILMIALKFKMSNFKNATVLTNFYRNQF